MKRSPVVRPKSPRIDPREDDLALARRSDLPRLGHQVGNGMLRLAPRA